MSDREWEFDAGDELIKADDGVEVDGVNLEDETVYTVKHRVVDYDDGKAFYHVEWSEPAPDDPISDTNTRRMLKNAEMVHGLYRSVDTESDHPEMDS